MNTSFDEKQAILSKSFALIQRTINKLIQLDQRQFPTDTTKEARDFLVASLKSLNALNFQKESIAPPVLYKSLLKYQSHVGVLERSTVDNISWPMVGYCDQIWKQLFPNEYPKIFYSTTHKHN